MKTVMKVVLITLAVIFAIWLFIVLYNVIFTKPAVIGLKDGKLQGCPNKPNCVCSQISKSGDSGHYIEPFNYTISEVELI
jgi:uncharacterized protein (DUF1499 family)